MRYLKIMVIGTLMVGVFVSPVLGAITVTGPTTVRLVSRLPFQSINVQGKIIGPDIPVDGSMTKLIHFKIYDRPTAGTALFTDSAAVQIKNGIFNTVLGTDTNPIDVAWDPESRRYYLGVQVDGETEEMSPRQELVSVPFAMIAKGVRGGKVEAKGDPAITAKNETVPLVVAHLGKSNIAVEGFNNMQTAGRLGYGSGVNFYGVYGNSNQATGNNYGVLGTARNFGVYGDGTGSTGVGVFGKGVGSGGFFESIAGKGLHAQSDASDAPAIYALNTNDDSSGSGRDGIYARSAKGRGIYVISDANTAIEAESNNVMPGIKSTSQTEGIYGKSTERYGNSVGVYGIATDTSSSSGPSGVKGESRGSGYGVYGVSTNGVGVLGLSRSATKAGVKAENVSGGPALEIGTEGWVKLPQLAGSVSGGSVTINSIAGVVTHAGVKPGSWVTVNNNKVTANSIIIATPQTGGGTIVGVDSITSGSFRLYVAHNTTSPVIEKVAFLVINK
jgi:hypothetical protein